MNELDRLRRDLLVAEHKASQAQRPRTGQDVEDLKSAAHRHDAIAVMSGAMRAREPLPGETPLEFRKALAGNLKTGSRFDKSDLRWLDASSFAVVEAQIYADAETTAMRNARGQKGGLVAVPRNVGGRTITEYHGDIAVAFAPFIRAGVGCKINQP